MPAVSSRGAAAALGDASAATAAATGGGGGGDEGPPPPLPLVVPGGRVAYWLAARWTSIRQARSSASISSPSNRA